MSLGHQNFFGSFWYSSLLSGVNTQEFETSEFERLPPETVMNLEIHFKAFYIMVYNIYLP